MNTSINLELVLLVIAVVIAAGAWVHLYRVRKDLYAKLHYVDRFVYPVWWLIVTVFEISLLWLLLQTWRPMLYEPELTVWGGILAFLIAVGAVVANYFAGRENIRDLLEYRFQHTSIFWPE